MLYVITAILLIVADQWTKYLTVQKIPLNGTKNIIDGILNFSYVRNFGAAFSMFQNARIFFIALTVILFTVGFFLIRKHKLNHSLSKVAVTLIAAGALGNFIDRVILGYVVDMIDLRFIHYPVFNVADCCLVVGCILLCIYVIFLQKEENTPSEIKIDQNYEEK